MGAIAGRTLTPMFLHPLQYGGRNLGKAYSFGFLCNVYFKMAERKQSKNILQYLNKQAK